MYVPLALTKNKVLYRDLWYNYGPLAAYLNALLFRLFGTHLNVLYIAGSVSALICALTLFLCAIRFLPVAGALLIAVVLILQSFHPFIFTFALPYNFSSVYAALFGALFLLSAIKAARREPGRNVLWAGAWAALALLTKTEFGLACCGSLVLLIAGRAWQDRRASALARDVIAVLPGAALSVLVFAWMISIGGWSFLTMENFLNWPGTYFMRVYGARWLTKAGFDLSPQSLTQTVIFLALFLALWLGVRRLLREPAPRRRWLIGTLAAAVAVGTGLWNPAVLHEILYQALFPTRMLVFVAAFAPVIAARFVKSRETGELALLVTGVFAVVFAARGLFKIAPLDYAVYYDGPAFVAFIATLTWMVWPKPGEWARRHRFWIGVLFASMAVEAVPMALSSYSKDAPRDPVLLRTARGNIYTERHKAETYPEVIDFMREANRRGEAVLSVPEDVSLYFFADVPCPTRVYVFAPGGLAPGKMTNEAISQMERGPVKYLVVSNRQFPEYGAPDFFDQEFGAYLRRKYRFVREFGPHVGSLPPDAWRIALWERIPPGGNDVR